MKLSQSDLIKLGLGGAAGYIGAKMLLPHRGFAKAGNCPSGRYCNGICCNHISASNTSDIPGCQIPCGWTTKQTDDYWRSTTGDPHGAIGGAIWQTGHYIQKTAEDSSGGPSRGGGGGPPDTGVDADCDSWGPFKGLCVLGKSATKGAQAGGGELTTWLPWIIGGGIVLILLVKR